jgi:hypothetical protein
MRLIWGVSMCFLQTGTAIIAPQFMIDEINNKDPESKMNVESMLNKKKYFKY